MTQAESGPPRPTDLAVAGYDDLPVSEVGQRIRSLTVHELGQLTDYERAHANRPVVLRVIDARLAELRSGAEGSGAVDDRDTDWPTHPEDGPHVR
ncbi:MAG: hypothetical protein ACRDN0_34460 [Trebonia sp.]